LVRSDPLSLRRIPEDAEAYVVRGDQVEEIGRLGPIDPGDPPGRADEALRFRAILPDADHSDFDRPFRIECSDGGADHRCPLQRGVQAEEDQAQRRCVGGPSRDLEPVIVRPQPESPMLYGDPQRR